MVEHFLLDETSGKEYDITPLFSDNPKIMRSFVNIGKRNLSARDVINLTFGNDKGLADFISDYHASLQVIPDPSAGSRLALIVPPFISSYGFSGISVLRENNFLRVPSGIVISEQSFESSCFLLFPEDRIYFGDYLDASKDAYGPVRYCTKQE